MVNFFNHQYPYSNFHELNLDWVISKLKEFETTLNSWIDTMKRLEEALNQLPGFYSRVEILENWRTNTEKLLTEIQQNISDIETRQSAIEDTYQYYNSKLAELEQLLDGVEVAYTQLVNDAKSELYARIAIEESERKSEDYKLLYKIQNITTDYDSQIADLYNKISQLVPTDVYNRIHGRRFSLDNNNYEVYEDLRYFGFTNSELASFGVSNDNIANICYNNRDYALNAKIRSKMIYPFNPITGIRQNLTNIISYIIMLIGKGVSNEQLETYMSDNSLTNDNISELITDNFNRYSLNI